MPNGQIGESADSTEGTRTAHGIGITNPYLRGRSSTSSIVIMGRAIPSSTAIPAEVPALRTCSYCWQNPYHKSIMIMTLSLQGCHFAGRPIAMTTGKTKLALIRYNEAGLSGIRTRMGEEA